MPHRARRPSLLRRRGGAAYVYMAVVFVALVGLSSLAVDFGRVQVARSELQAAADAAARYAVTILGGGAQPSQVINGALDAAGDNRADGQTVVLQRTDVELGRWDATAGQFRANQLPADAVRVTARRTAATGQPVPLMFGQVVGKPTMDVTAVAVALWTARPLGIIGTDSIDMGSKALTDSYDSSAGAYSAATARSQGDIKTNGDIDLSGTVLIHGDARPGNGRRVTTGPGVVISGVTTPLTSRLSFPSVSAGSAATVNDNANVPAAFVSNGRLTIGGSDVVRLPAGTYYFTGLSMSGSGVLELQGPVTMYVNGDVTLGEGARTWASRPIYFELRVIGGGTVQLNTGADVHAIVYAPDARVLIGGSGELFGSIIGRSLRVTAHGGIHFDESLPGGAGAVSLVK